MIDTSYFSSGFQPAPRSTRFDGFAPRVGRSDQAIFGDQLIASRQPRNLIGRDPLAQFDGSPTSEAAKLALQNQRNVMRQSIKDLSPSGIESLIGTIISLATGIPVNLGSNLKTINRKGTELSRAFAQGLGIPRRETTGTPILNDSKVVVAPLNGKGSSAISMKSYKARWDCLSSILPINIILDALTLYFSKRLTHRCFILSSS